jgi:hypothetical protein
MTAMGLPATTRGYSATTNLHSQIKATGVQHYDYSFDGATGNLNSRQNSQGNRLRKNRIKIKTSGNRGFSYGLQFILFNTSLFKNRIQRSGRNIFVVHWYYGTFTGNRVQPNLMASTATV